VSARHMAAASVAEGCVEWLEGFDGGPKLERAPVRIHFGGLFVGGRKACALHKELAMAPWRGEPGEVYLRLVEGRLCRLSFAEAQRKGADAVFEACMGAWRKAAKAAAKEDALAPSVAGLLDGISASSTNSASSSRPRSRSPPAAAPAEATRFREASAQLGSTQAELNWRQQQAQTIGRQQAELREEAVAHLAREEQTRSCMTRRELYASLEKERRISEQMRTKFEALQEERRRIDALRSEEERLCQTLREVCAEDDDKGDGAGVKAECIICCDRGRNVVYLPCKHLVCCARCGMDATKVDRCPVCRVRIAWRFRAFF